MNLFVDSSFFVAIILNDDTNHTLATKLSNNIAEGNIFTNNLAKYEAYNVICRKNNVKMANYFLKWLSNSNILNIEISEKIWQNSVCLLTKKYTKSGPNVFDFIHFASMQEYGLKDVLTFDHHFSSAGFNILK